MVIAVLSLIENVMEGEGLVFPKLVGGLIPVLSEVLISLIAVRLCYGSSADLNHATAGEGHLRHNLASFDYRTWFEMHRKAVHCILATFLVVFS